MTNKTVIDLMENYVRVARMVEAYNREHDDADLKPWECVSVDNTRDCFDGDPLFTESPDRYQFAVAILEGKPVFVGDTVYTKHPDSTLSMLVGQTTLWYLKNHKWTWTKPTPKRTFTLNGVELPCPENNNKTNYGFTIKTKDEYYYFYFRTMKDKDLVANTILEILSEARDSHD